MMVVNITIRNVPGNVRDGLADRAAKSGYSMQEFLLRELVAIVQKPSPLEALQIARAHAETLRPYEIEELLEELDADRR